jgi:hypothetical protein
VSVRTSGTSTNAYGFVIWHSHSMDTTDAADSVGMGALYPHCCKSEYAKLE